MAEILIGNIKGPQGAKGDKGDKGDTGPQGPAGPQGATGPMPALVNGFTTTEAGVAALDAAAGKTLKDQLDQQNSDIQNTTMRIFNYSSQEFDFNNPDYPAGTYRLGAEQYLINQPSIAMAFSTLLIIKDNAADTLAIVGFPYNDYGTIIIRQSNKAGWSAAPWFKLEGVAI